MKILFFGSMVLVSLLLVSWQHRQLNHVRAENTSLARSAAEADQLKSDLARSARTEAQGEDEIVRLREENHDLLRLRNEVGQLRDARAEFERVSAENKRLQTAAKSAVKTEAKQPSIQPILIRVDSLYNCGFSTPEAAAQTVLWAEHTGNVEALSRGLPPKRWSMMYDSAPDRARRDLLESMRSNLDRMVSIEIVARRDIDAATVQLGIALHSKDGSMVRIVYTLSLQDGNWQVDPGVYQ